MKSLKRVRFAHTASSSSDSGEDDTEGVPSNLECICDEETLSKACVTGLNSVRMPLKHCKCPTIKLMNFSMHITVKLVQLSQKKNASS